MQYRLYTTTDPWAPGGTRTWKEVFSTSFLAQANRVAKSLPQDVWFRLVDNTGHEWEWDNFSGFIHHNPCDDC